MMNWQWLKGSSHRLIEALPCLGELRKMPNTSVSIAGVSTDVWIRYLLNPVRSIRLILGASFVSAINYTGCGFSLFAFVHQANSLILPVIRFLLLPFSNFLTLSSLRYCWQIRWIRYLYNVYGIQGTSLGLWYTQRNIKKCLCKFRSLDAAFLSYGPLEKRHPERVDNSQHGSHSVETTMIFSTCWMAVVKGIRFGYFFFQQVRLELMLYCIHTYM